MIQENGYGIDLPGSCDQYEDWKATKEASKEGNKI